MDTEFNLTNPNIYAFIIFGVIIYFIFRILHFVNKKITYKNILKPKIAKSIYILELFTWFLFLFKSIQHFTTKNPLFSYLLIFILAFLLIWTLWYILKDYFAGLYIKICGKYKKDDIISFDTISGKIVKFAERKLIIETNGLQNLEIPYSKLFD
ncbi:MAG: hypothetical protein JXA16_07880, partial [Bacteroidales bacterium]|nr:hypothetical protein [Bacteroidales bacterium]